MPTMVPVGLVLRPDNPASARLELLVEADIELLADVDVLLDHGAQAAAAEVQRPARDLEAPRE